MAEQSTRSHAPIGGVLLGEYPIFGERCPDGGKCHHGCVTSCTRQDGCVPLSGSQLSDTWTADVHQIPAIRRHRQERVHAWCVEAFGAASAVSVPELGLRLAEEALEAAQAAGVDVAQMHRLVDYVYARPVGVLEQELGGVGLTALALASAAGLDADRAEQCELERVLSKPPGYCAARNRAKVAAGFGIPSGNSAKMPQAVPFPPDLHPATGDLVTRFASALAEKLAEAEHTYGWDTHWTSPAWMDQCRAQLVEHVAKGDPRDVAAYSAFLWHHGERTALPAVLVPGDWVSLLREAADVLEAVGLASKELPSNWRWPLADELSGMAAMLNAATQLGPGPGTQTAREVTREPQPTVVAVTAAIDAQHDAVDVGR